MKRQRVLTEKAANAKIVFKGVVVEIKKVSDQEVELTFPEKVDTKELLSYLESFGVLKRKVVTPHLELQPEVRTDEIVPEAQETQADVENYEKQEVKKEYLNETKEQANESSQAEDNTTTSRKRKRKS
jgi:RNA recognition motif-containing protein